MRGQQAKQAGFVSIIVAAILMVLLSLVTIGFSQIMQREQRQALDRQLSSQAFYAAETGVNDVYNAIASGATIPEEKTDCDVVADWNSGIIDPEEPGVAYTCLKYDQTPTDLVFTDSITTEGSKIFPIQPEEAGANVATTTFAWNGTQGSTVVNSNACSGDLPPAFAAGSVPMLRMDIIPVPTSGAISRDGLINSTANLYLNPVNNSCGASSIDFSSYNGANTASVVDVDCRTNGCSLEITGMSASDRYYIRVRSVYTNVGTLTVNATSTSVTPGTFEFKNAQTVVDATGKANDVLRRIEVRLSNAPDYRVPEAVIEASDGVCKLIQIAPASPLTNSAVTNADCY